MRRLKLAFLLLMVGMSLIAGGLPMQQAHAQSTASKAASDYLNQALDFMQENAVHANTLDWKTLRAQALERIQNAQVPADTYPTITWALQQLGDHHSFFLDPEAAKRNQQGYNNVFGLNMTDDGTITDIIAGGPADKAGNVRRGDIVQKINGIVLKDQQAINDSLRKNPSSATLSIQQRDRHRSFDVTLKLGPYESNKRPQARLVKPGIAYIELPAVMGGKMAEEYATIVQQEIQDLDQNNDIRGWIVDLRNNNGGNCWPMLAGIGPVVGEGKLGSFFTQGQAVGTWTYSNGKALSGDQVAAQVQHPYTLRHPLPPVAVLTSPITASSGEAVTIAFRGRPNTRSFGEPTYGVPTANYAQTLSDGAQIYLTVAIDADRTGKTYDSPISPDQGVHIDWATVYTQHDQVIKVAAQWLQHQPGR